MSRRTRKGFLHALVSLIASRVSGWPLRAIVIWCMLRQCMGVLVLPPTWRSTYLKPSTKIVLTPRGWSAAGRRRTDGPVVAFLDYVTLPEGGSEETGLQVALMQRDTVDLNGYSKGRAITSRWCLPRNENIKP